MPASLAKANIGSWIGHQARIDPFEAEQGPSPTPPLREAEHGGVGATGGRRDGGQRRGTRLPRWGG